MMSDVYLLQRWEPLIGGVAVVAHQFNVVVARFA